MKQNNPAGQWTVTLGVGLGAVMCAMVAGHGGASAGSASTPAPPVLRLATTTSTADTGLLAAILPAFERSSGCRVDVIAVGTGQALEIGRRGDADVVLVHARKAEDQFLVERHARERFDVMYNDFVIVGPTADPAKIAALRQARQAFAAIARAGATFLSRADKSGTHIAELAIWAALEIDVEGAGWYRALGQGMGETLVVAEEQGAYTLADRATYLAMRDKLPHLRILVGGDRPAENPDPTLRNSYSVMAVNPDLHPGVNFALASRFIEWLLSADTQRAIGDFGLARLGQPLFYPDSDEYKATRQIVVKSAGGTRSFTLTELQGFPRVVLANHAVVGVKKGPLGTYSWTGASLKDVLLRVDPTLGHTRNSSTRIVVTSSDGWTATLLWGELFGTLARGEALYNVKGCNECHGVVGEGTSPAGKRPAPALARRKWSVDRVLTLLRAGRDAHAGLNSYTADRLTPADLPAMLAWLERPEAGANGERYRPARDKRAVLLAYERNGQPMSGRDGLIQLVVGPDEFASRYSHWVKTIEVVSAAQ
jgi:tungstate transport system substrate-binding protein